ncbi:hypothetical protein H2199_004451 [Coniosporium tulheliwenetii]|uniref:Uncharacterized protein n=1 Tax=Coniosporium tulheliwenetii TaxID=3383036 RepID=A0ACC2Z6S4_9PEZI|nr:hypothetical protein H2199_004451 [Cladosporium sp. JES 115]
MDSMKPKLLSFAAGRIRGNGVRGQQHDARTQTMPAAAVWWEAPPAHDYAVQPGNGHPVIEAGPPIMRHSVPRTVSVAVDAEGFATADLNDALNHSKWSSEWEAQKAAAITTEQDTRVG